MWGPPFLILLVGTGVYLSIRLGFFQFTGLGLAWRKSFGTLFTKKTSAEGAAVSDAIRRGVARGVFSNEAGLGSASIAHAQAKNTPVRQGMWGMWEVFIDTLVVCTMTALVVLVTDALPTGLTGAVGGLHLIWDIADTLNGLMAIPNLIALVALAGVLAKDKLAYMGELKAGKDV